jgi:hypothetical protein
MKGAMMSAQPRGSIQITDPTPNQVILVGNLPYTGTAIIPCSGPTTPPQSMQVQVASQSLQNMTNIQPNDTDPDNYQYHVGNFTINSLSPQIIPYPITAYGVDDQGFPSQDTVSIKIFNLTPNGN